MNSPNMSVAAEYRLSAGNNSGFVPPDEISRLYDVLEQLSENDCGETYLLAEKPIRYFLDCQLQKKTKYNIITVKGEIYYAKNRRS